MAAAKFQLPTIRTQTPHYQPLGSGNIPLSATIGNLGTSTGHLQIVRLYNLLQPFDVFSVQGLI